MEKTTIPSFVTELPLITTPTDEKRLRARLEAARQVYNACLGESLNRLDLVRQSKEYQTARQMPRGQKNSAKAKARSKAFRQANKAVGFREYDLHSYAAQFNHCWIGEHLDINTIQKLATRAFKAVQQYSFGNLGRPRFKGKNQMDSIEGKSNVSGMRWREPRVEWLGLELETVIDYDDLVIAHGLNSRVKFVRIVRRKRKGSDRYYVQLVCEGKPFQKPKNKIGEGDVGLDLGPSTIAVVGQHEAFLERFCDELKPIQKEIRRQQRHLDRQRRANNPDNYNPDGTIRRGPKTWHKSGRQRRTEARLAELYRQQAAHRKSLHGQLVNRILRMGNVIKLENLSYRAFQHQFGRSVGMRAPGMCVAHLKRKAESADAEVAEFPTRSTRLSQTCHGCGTLEKKPLSQRWHECDCGVVAQRDLYSATDCLQSGLAQCVEGERLNTDRAQAAWSDGADGLLQAALSRIEQPANGRRLPASFGLSGRRQSGSPVKSIGNSEQDQNCWAVPLELHVNASKAQDVVPPSTPMAGELEKARWIVRTPRL